MQNYIEYAILMSFYCNGVSTTTTEKRQKEWHHVQITLSFLALIATTKRLNNSKYTSLAALRALTHRLQHLTTRLIQINRLWK